MKHFIAIFLTLTMEFFTSISYSEEKSVEVIKQHWLEDTRSVSCVPTITHDSNTLYIYSNVILDNLHIIIKDTRGTTLYSCTTTILNNQCYSFTIDNIKEGDFIIELKHEKKYLYGYFSIHQ